MLQFVGYRSDMAVQEIQVLHTSKNWRLYYGSTKNRYYACITTSNFFHSASHLVSQYCCIDLLSSIHIGNLELDAYCTASDQECIACIQGRVGHNISPGFCVFSGFFLLTAGVQSRLISNSVTIRTHNVRLDIATVCGQHYC